MTFDEYLEVLLKFNLANQKYRNLKVYVIADHGQRVEEIMYSPSLGHVNSDGDWIDLENFEEYELDRDNDVNAILIN